MRYPILLLAVTTIAGCSASLVGPDAEPEIETKTTTCVGAKTWGGGDWSPKCPTGPTPNLPVPIDSVEVETFGDCIVAARGPGWIALDCPLVHDF